MGTDPTRPEIILQVETFLSVQRVERGLSENSISAYRSDLIDFAEKTGLTEPRQLDRSVVTRYVGLLTSSGAKPRTIARRLTSIRRFISFLAEAGLVKGAEKISLRAPRLTSYHPEVLSEREVEMLFASVEKMTHGRERARAVLELIYGTGIRISELAGLTWNSLELEAGFVRVLGKGNKERLVPLGSAAVVGLKEYQAAIEARGNDSPHFLFPGRFGKQMSRVGLWKYIRQLVATSGILRRVTPHMFRHSFATHLLAGGADLRSVQEMLGHADISTTEVYTRIDRDYITAEHRQFHPRELAGLTPGDSDEPKAGAAFRRPPKRRRS